MNAAPANNWPPLIVNEALSVEPVPPTRVYVKVLSASESVVESVPMKAPSALFSAIEVADRAMSVGISLTFVTEIANAFSVKSPPWSVERTRTK